MDVFLEQLKSRDQAEAPAESANPSEMVKLRQELEAQFERSRTFFDQVIQLKEQVVILQRQGEEKDQIAIEKNKSIEMLQDELLTLQLELSQSESQVSKLKEENQDLIRRWVQRIDSEAARYH